MTNRKAAGKKAAETRRRNKEAKEEQRIRDEAAAAGQDTVQQEPVVGDEPSGTAAADNNNAQGQAPTQPEPEVPPTVRIPFLESSEDDSEARTMHVLNHGVAGTLRRVGTMHGFPRMDPGQETALDGESTTAMRQELHDALDTSDREQLISVDRRGRRADRPLLVR